MKITKATVSAGRTFNHPFEQFSNFRCHAEIEIEIGDEEDALAQVKAAQAEVEGLVEDHKLNLLKSVEELENMRRASAEIKGLQRQLAETQQRLDAIRQRHPEVALLSNSETAGA